MDIAIQERRATEKKEDEKIKAEPKTTIAKPLKNSQLPLQNSAKAVMNNDTKSITMVLYRSHDWYGSVLASYPYGITSGNFSQFVHLADPTNGSKGAVVYYGTINPTTEGAWLLAWSAPVGTDSIPPNNQVYVETGKKEEYENTNWTVIQEKLDKSSNLSNYRDPITGCFASAEINQNNNTAVIVAHFN